MSDFSPAQLRQMSEAQLAGLVAELEERAELFDARVRMYVNDELRRRHLPPIRGRR